MYTVEGSSLFDKVKGIRLGFNYHIHKGDKLKENSANEWRNNACLHRTGEVTEWFDEYENDVNDML